MTNNVKNYNSMVERTQLTMQNNNTLWSGKPKMVTKIGEITAIQTALNVLSKKQGVSTGGATGTKKTDRVVAGLQSFHLQKILQSFYLDIKDQVSYDTIEFSVSDYTQGNIKDSIKKMNQVYDLVTAINIKSPLALKDFNLSDTDIAELKTDIDAVTAISPLPSTMKSTNKAITKEINVQMRLLKNAMDGLDVNMNTFTKTQPAFSDVYFAGRRIVNTGVGHKTAEVALMPEQTEAVLGNKYTVGDVLTIRNKSAFAMQYGLTHDAAVLPTKMMSLEGNTEIKMTVELDSTGNFGHWLVLHNPHDMDDVDVTVLLAKGKN